MVSTYKVAGLGFIIIIAAVLAAQLSGITNTESRARISFLTKFYSIRISSNTSWMVTGTIDTDQDSLPIMVSEHRGTYMYRNFRNPREIYLLISRMDFGLVENAFLRIELLKGNKVINIVEARDFTLEFKWRKPS